MGPYRVDMSSNHRCGSCRDIRSLWRCPRKGKLPGGDGGVGTWRRPELLFFFFFFLSMFWWTNCHMSTHPKMPNNTSVHMDHSSISLLSLSLNVFLSFPVVYYLREAVYYICMFIQEPAQFSLYKHHTLPKSMSLWHVFMVQLNSTLFSSICESAS